MNKITMKDIVVFLCSVVATVSLAIIMRSAVAGSMVAERALAIIAVGVISISITCLLRSFGE